MKERKGQRYGYMILSKSGAPLLLGSHMPIFWMKRIAKENAKNFEGSRVIKVWLMEWNELVRL